MVKSSKNEEVLSRLADNLKQGAIGWNVAIRQINAAFEIDHLI